MAAIGGVVCNMVKGDGVANTERLDVYQVPGHDGYGALKLGLGDSRFSFRGIEFDSLANIRTWIGSIEALKGLVISIVDDFGETHTNLLLMSVSQARRQTVVYNGVTQVRGEISVQGVVRT